MQIKKYIEHDNKVFRRPNYSRAYRPTWGGGGVTNSAVGEFPNEPNHHPLGMNEFYLTN